MIRNFLLATVLTFIALNGFSQTSCEYRIEMYDNFGDGWNNASLEITSNAISYSATLLDGDFDEFTFEVVNGAPFSIDFVQGDFDNEISFIVFNSDNDILFVGAPPFTTGPIFSGNGFCPSCPRINGSSVVTAALNSYSGQISWGTSTIYTSFTIIYGPEGFNPTETGLTLTTTSATQTIRGLNPCVTYDFYIIGNCTAIDRSSLAGPFQLTTPNSIAPGPTCNYTLEMISPVNGGWFLGDIEVNSNGVLSNFTLDFGDTLFATIPATSNTPLSFTWTDQFGINDDALFNIYDANGLLIFSSGFAPPSGLVYSIPAACPTCQGPEDLIAEDVNATNTRLTWSISDNTSPYVLEYGTTGFTRGTGTSISTANTGLRINNLTEHTWYDAYLYQTCGADTSKAFGPVSFQTVWLNDVGASAILNPSFGNCGYNDDENVTIAITNYGQTPQTLFPYYFSVNGQPASIQVPLDGFFADVIGNDSTTIVEFDVKGDFSQPGFFDLLAWTELENDSDTSNDTTAISFFNMLPLSIFEDFEASLNVPQYWDITNGFIADPGDHANATNLYAINLWLFNQEGTLTSPRVGIVQPTDSLVFDYRFVGQNGAAYPLQPGDKLDVQISEDCGENWATIASFNNTNHINASTLRRRRIPLGSYAGSGITVRFLGTYGDNDTDFFLDLDNINIRGCSDNFETTNTITNVSTFGANDGSITVTPTFGTPPFLYDWINGQTTATITDLGTGTYTVTITDALDCQEIVNVQVGSLTATEDKSVIAPKVLLAPNPANDRTQLTVHFEEPSVAQLLISNLSGQVIRQKQFAKTSLIQEELTVNQLPDGMYIISIRTEKGIFSYKLIVRK